MRKLQQVKHGRAILAAASAIALLGAVVIFFTRTLMQPQYKPSDLAVYYTASRAWVAGANPYDVIDAPRRWQEAGGQPHIMPEPEPGVLLTWMPIILLPPTLPLLAPLAVLPSTSAIWTWYTLAGLLLIAQTVALADMIGVRLWQPLGLLLLAATLVLAPVHESFGYAQPSGPTISLMVIGAWAAWRRLDVAAGITIGIATALKPQLGAVLLLYFVLTRRWRLAVACTATVLLLAAVALVPMALRHTPWLSSWRSNMAEGDRLGGFNSPFPENALRRHMLNLQILFGGIFSNFAVVNALAIGSTAFMAAAVAVRCARRNARRDELLMLSIVCVLGLLPVYHRFYDAAILVFPIAWALSKLRDGQTIGWIVLAFAVTFVIPTPAMARILQHFGVDAFRAAGLWWDFVLEPWRIWVLLFGFVVLWRALGRVNPELFSAETRAEQTGAYLA